MAETSTAGAMPAAAGATSAQSTPAADAAPGPATGTAEAEPAEASLGDAGQRALAAERKTAKDATRRADEAEKALKAFQDAAMTESEKRDRRLAELEVQAAEWQKERADLRLAMSVERGAAVIGFIDPAEALALLDRGELEVDPVTGDARNVDAVLRHLAKARPHLVRRAYGSADAGGDGKPQTTFTREQLRDARFFAEHKAEILAAQREGRIAG